MAVLYAIYMYTPSLPFEVRCESGIFYHIMSESIVQQMTRKFHLSA